MVADGKSTVGTQEAAALIAGGDGALGGVMKASGFAWLLDWLR